MALTDRYSTTAMDRVTVLAPGYVVTLYPCLLIRGYMHGTLVDTIATPDILLA